MHKSSLLYEQQICELYELADSLSVFICEFLNNGMSLSDILAQIANSISLDNTDVPGDALEENIGRLTQYNLKVNEISKAVFSDLLFDSIKQLGKISNESDFLAEKNIDESFTYVKNSFADEAFDVFSQNFSDPRVKYSKTIKDSIDLVLSGDCGYCLLPLEEATTRLSTVAEFIYRANLKINSITPVFGFDGKAKIKYALCSKHYSVPKISDGDDRYLEIMIPTDRTVSLSGFLSASECLGNLVFKVNTVTLSSDNRESTYFSVVFKREEGDFTSLLFYLTLFVKDFSVVGIYKNYE